MLIFGFLNFLIGGINFLIFTEKVYSVLLVSNNEKFNKSLISLCQNSKITPVEIVPSIATAKRAVLVKNYDIVIINTPLPDEFGANFAIDVCNGKQTVALLIIKSELYEEITAKVTDFGVFTLAKPTSSILVQNAVNWMLSCRERLRRIDNKTLSIEEKMEEIRLVNRAKWLLIENLKMSEKDAHRYIEKQSMDRCVSRKIIVEEIIKTYK